MIRVSNLCFLLLLQFSLCCSLLHTPAFAAKQSYIIYLGAHSHGPNPTAADIDRAENFHHEFLGSILGSCDMAKESITSSYRRHINGFAAELEDEHAQQLANHPDVVSIFLNKSKKKHTTRVWKFLDVEGDNNVVPSNSAWKIGRFGEDVIIGGIDSGVWPESESFNDRELGPVPSKWGGRCQNDTRYGVQCNGKLIGVKYYNKGIVSAARKKNSSFTTPPEYETGRDLNGHGTHILSTAGGSFVPNVSVYGSGYGTAKGGSPRARVASYKVCFKNDGEDLDKPDDGDDNKDENDAEGDADCTDQDTLDAIDDAINDGVDVLTVSLGNEEVHADSFEDAISIGSFHAMMKGIPTIASAGNEGPDPKTVKNSVPWIFTVGASSIDREFASYVTLGNKKHFKGRGISSKAMPSQDTYPLIAAADARVANATESDATQCKPGTMDPEKVEGKIVICRGLGDGIKEGFEASQAGALGMIWGCVDDKEKLSDEDDTINCLPFSKLNPKDIDSVFDYVEVTQDPVTSMTAKTEVGIEPSPVMGSYSSRGPNPIDPAILKPDVTAPGTNIIAANTEEKAQTDGLPDDRRISFVTMTGTSMSTPLVAGIVGLIKTVHPKWSPAAIKSAIMTTAFTEDANKQPILDFNGAKATPFAYGSGHVNPNRAMDPGLVYDLAIEDYLAYICNRRQQKDIVKIFALDPEKYSCPQSFDVANFNYPSIAIPDLTDSVTVTRKLKNVGAPGTYKAQVAEIPGIEVNVEPNSLNFTEVGEEKKFKVTFTPEENVKPNNDYVFGELIWSDGTHEVRSPIALKLRQQ